MDQKIIFNGKTYNSLEEMPPGVRQAYEAIMNVLGDKNKNGVPDLLENLPDGALRQTFNVQVNRPTIIHDGQVYHSVDELPADLRAKYEEKMNALDADHNGIPDILEGRMGNSASASPDPAPTPSLAPSEPDFPVSAAIPISATPVIEPEDNSSSLRWIILGAGLLFIVCLGVLAAWLIFSAR